MKSTTPKTLDALALLEFGMEEFKSKYQDYLKLILVFIGLSILPSVFFGKTTSLVWLIYQISSFVYSVWLTNGAVRIGLKIYRREDYQLTEIFSGKDILKPTLIVTLKVMLKTLLGFLLLIVPGIIWTLQLQFAYLLVIDKNLTPEEAIEKSKQMTSGHLKQLFWISLLIILINLAGAAALVVGLLFTVPVTVIAHYGTYKYLYAKLKKQQA